MKDKWPKEGFNTLTFKMIRKNSISCILSNSLKNRRIIDTDSTKKEGGKFELSLDKTFNIVPTGMSERYIDFIFIVKTYDTVVKSKDMRMGN